MTGIAPPPSCSPLQLPQPFGREQRRQVRHKTPVSLACSPQACLRGHTHRLLDAPRSASPAGLAQRSLTDLVAPAPPPGVAACSSPSLPRERGITLHLEMARRATARQEDFHVYPWRVPTSRFASRSGQRLSSPPAGSGDRRH